LQVHDTEHWLKEIYSSEWTAKFRHWTDRYARFTDPEQLMKDARQQLALRLQRKGESGSATPLTEGYILTAFRHAVVDLHRRQNGRAGPHRWLKAFGRLGQLLYDLYCLARLPRSEVIAALGSDPELERRPPTPEQASSLLDEMDRRGECEDKGSREQPLPDEAGNPLQAPDLADPAQSLMQAQSEGLQAYLFRSEVSDFAGIERLVERIQNTRTQLPGRLELDDDQRFILQATLSGELTEAQMGALLGGLTVRQVRYKRQQAIDTMKKLLRKAGLTLQELLYDEPPAQSLMQTGR
jgi:hypothetical protein